MQFSLDKKEDEHLSQALFQRVLEQEMLKTLVSRGWVCLKDGLIRTTLEPASDDGKPILMAKDVSIHLSDETSLVLLCNPGIVKLYHFDVRPRSRMPHGLVPALQREDASRNCCYVLVQSSPCLAMCRCLACFLQRCARPWRAPDAFASLTGSSASLQKSSSACGACGCLPWSQDGSPVSPRLELLAKSPAVFRR